MSIMEGTKLGGNYFSAEEALDIGKSAPGNEDFKGTKLGEESDFEKSLGLKDAPVASAKPVGQVTTAPTQAFEPITSGETPKTAVHPVDDIMFQGVKDYQTEDIVNGIVTRIEKGLVFVDIAYKSEGIIEPDELSSIPGTKPGDVVQPGQKIHVMILKLENREGHPMLSKRRADYEVYWSALSSAYKKKEAITVYVTNAVKGGLVVDLGGIRGFVPASHVSKDYQDNLEALMRQKIQVIPIDVDRKRRKIVLSHKLAAKQNSSDSAKELLKGIEPGQVRNGTVTSIKPFGAFVDIGGIKGLVHVSEMSWGRINNPEEVLSVGQKLDVFVLGVDDETGKISLGLKQLQPDPWVNVEQRYHIGDKVHGVVTRLVVFGAFVELEKGIEGLIHISELAEKQPNNPEEIVRSGQHIEAKIIKMFPAEQRIGLSLREHPEIEAKKDTDTYRSEKAASSDSTPTIGDLVNEARLETQA